MFIFSCTILLGSTFLYSKLNANIYDKQYFLHFPQKDVSLIVVNSAESRSRGLGGMKSISDDQAMLFVFDEPAKYGIWMKDMNFTIDIFWLDEFKKIVTIQHNISPDTYPKIFYPESESSYVLETKGGFAKKNNLEVGNVLGFDLK